MNDCLFCKIIAGEIPSFKVDESNNHLAILDIFPNTKGLTLIIPKKHLESDVFSMNEKEFHEIFDFSKIIAKKLEKGLGVKRVAMISEGMGIDHAHIKLYPLQGLKEKFEETWHHEKIFFQKYEGYITTLMGERADDKELNELSEKLQKIK